MSDYDELSGQLFRVTRLMERVHARQAARRPGTLERAAYLLLVYLVKNGPQRLSALADGVHSDASTVSRQAAHLVKLGLLERQPDPADGRASLLAATEAGRNLFDEARKRRNDAFATFLADWPAEDHRRLAELLGRFNDDFEAHFLGDN